jgi:hypothetical protein
VDAEEAPPPPGRRRGRGPLAVAALGLAAGSSLMASATRARDLRAFLSWAISAGTAQLAQVNFQPLPPAVVALSQAQMAKIR